MPKTYKIAVIHGDGIGYEINSSTIEVLKESLKDKHILDFVEYSGGAQCYLETGTSLPGETLEGCKNADAILFGAVGDPKVTYPDGTEVGLDCVLKLRFMLDIYANVRYVKW